MTSEGVDSRGGGPESSTVGGCEGALGTIELVISSVMRSGDSIEVNATSSFDCAECRRRPDWRFSAVCVAFES